jgi:predicted transcriptional regulator
MPTMVEITKRSRERRAQALSMRRAGKLLREIGEEFGVTVETARQMVLAGERQERRAALRRCPVITKGE